MKLLKPADNIYHISCDTMKELTLTFCRVQEFYESPIEGLRGRYFDFFEFIQAQMKDDGRLDYFKDWAGFNFPSDVYWKWLNAQGGEHTRLERQLMDLLPQDIEPKFYVIGTLEDDVAAIDHELAHAYFYLNEDYREEVKATIAASPTELTYNLQTHLLGMGYDESVLYDEVNAYLATSNAHFLSDFGIDYYEYQSVIDHFHAMFEEQNG